MAEINLFNSAGRDAVVKLQPVVNATRVRWLDGSSRQVSSVRLIKSAIHQDLDSLTERFGDLRKVGEALLNEDPEIDAELTGRYLQDTSRVYVDRARKVVHRVREWDVIKNPDGSERDRRPRQVLEANIGADLAALKWTGTLIPKADAIRKFVFVQKMALAHTSGLTYDFLYGIAKELEQKNSLLLLGAGPKSKEPLVLRRGGSAFRGFLEGRTQGDTYRVTLHLSNLELKAPEARDS